MFFSVMGFNSEPKPLPNKAFLISSNWDDWGSFQTQYYLVVFGPDGKEFTLGDVKIGQYGLKPGSRHSPEPNTRTPAISNEFEALDEQFFSLGQNETYYETLNTLPPDLRQAVLSGLQDCASSLSIFENALNERVMRASLLRSISVENVRNRFHRLALGDANLTEFEFEYIFPPTENTESPVLVFDVQPLSTPPSNIHVIIGRNGVGKSRCLRLMASAVLGIETDAGEIQQVGANRKNWTVAGLIFISFSAFDDFELPKSKIDDVRSAMIGLRSRKVEDENLSAEDRKVDNQASLNDVPLLLKTPEEIAKDFSNSFGKCRKGLRSERWRKAIRTLESDPLFAEADLTSLLISSEEEWLKTSQVVFRQLSSGHAIVLLTITRLVELVDERTLVLFDEPEGHLHPPLLSAFIRSLSDLLIQRNGIAIIATHSPVVLQEVPKSCVWMLRRSGNIAVAERPAIETFGENVGILTREVFGLEVTNAGFHNLIRNAVETEGLDYKDVLTRFDEQLGAEARAIAKGLIANRDAKK